jgi:hypothetical protein
MSVVYGQLAAKQAAAKILAKAGKKQFEYDSDEDVEDGRLLQFCTYIRKDKCTIVVFTNINFVLSCIMFLYFFTLVPVLKRSQKLLSRYLLGILVVLFFMVIPGPLKERQVVFIHVVSVLGSRVFS